MLMSNQIQKSEVEDPIQLQLNQWNDQKTEENAKSLKKIFEDSGVSKTKDMLSTLSNEYKVSKAGIEKLLKTDAFRSKYDKKKKALRNHSQEEIPSMSS